MKILVGIIGAILGSFFGVDVALAAVELLSRGNTLGAGFLLLIAGPLCLLTGAILGAVVALRFALFFREVSTSEVVKRRKRRVLVGLVLGIPAAFVAINMISREAAKPPSDSAMLKDFEEHASTFDSLVKMASADRGLARVDEDWTMPSDTRSVGVSSERLSIYRELLRNIGTPRGFQLSKDQAGIDFYFWLRGSAISDDETKGFAYRENPPTHIVSGLDDIRDNGREYLIVYRHIRDNWYLFYEFIPG